MNKRLIASIGVLSFFMYISAQERVLSIDELFQLADQNSKSIQLHALAIDESAQAVKVAKDARLPSIRAQVDLNYIGDGCMTDRDFSNGIHADMPHFGNTFVLKASQVIYAGGKHPRKHTKSETTTPTVTTDLRQQSARFTIHVAGLLLGFVPTSEPTNRI